MIEYEKFEYYMDKYKKIGEQEATLNKALYEMSNDFGGYYNDNVHELILKLLKDITHDSSDWIGYYIYELNWGENYKEGYVVGENGENIPLETVKDLYNLLKEEFENE